MTAGDNGQVKAQPSGMRISIFGLGYVGCTLATCMASDGHQVMAVDKDASRAAALAGGELPFADEGLRKLLAQHHANIWAVSDPARAVLDSEVSFVCVGTPRADDGGGYDLSQLRLACEQIGAALAQKESYHIVVIKSTLTPGVMEGFVIPTLESASGKVAGRDFEVVFNPEFLQEGNAKRDYYFPTMTVVGGPPEMRRDRHVAILALRKIFDFVHGPFLVTDYKSAEMLKLTCNAWHAVKVCFANEIGNLCQTTGADSEAVMGMFAKDTRLNISTAYLKPGFAFGGSCLTKDVGALSDLAEGSDLSTPMLRSVLASNQDQIDLAEIAVLVCHPWNVGVIGLAFKPGLSDFRGSPGMKLVEQLQSHPLLAVIRYDPQSPLEAERNLSYALACDVVVLATAVVSADEVRQAVSAQQTVIDLAHVMNGPCAAKVVRLT